MIGRKSARLFFPLHPMIKREYRALPWPETIKKIVIYIHVKGGRGDIVAAAKVIGMMQRICPTLEFDWVVHNIESYQGDPKSFLTCDDPDSVHLRKEGTPEAETGDFLLTGPVDTFWNREQIINTYVKRKIEGPFFLFCENAQLISSMDPKFLPSKSEMTYEKLQIRIFPPSLDYGGKLSMGLQPGSGIFLDQSRIDAELSREDCCPSYLSQIENQELYQDIAAAMGGKIDYELNSLNFGYAHHPISWSKFIISVAIHERSKDVTIVLNQAGAICPCSDQSFIARVFKDEYLELLKSKGYGTITIKGEKESRVLVLGNGWRLNVIIRPSFTPSDVRSLQLASERLLATGDNSALEA
jgi:hypothetical protein